MAFVAGKISENEQRGLTRERKIMMQDSNKDTETWSSRKEEEEEKEEEEKTTLGANTFFFFFFFFFTVKSSWAVERKKSTRLLVSLRQNEGCPRRGRPEVRST